MVIIQSAMGNVAAGKASDPIGGALGVDADKLKKSWADGRASLAAFDKKDRDLTSISPGRAAIVSQLVDTARSYDVVVPIVGHYLCYYEIMVAVSKEYQAESIDRLAGIVDNTALWFIRSELLLSSDENSSPEFLLCLQHYSRRLHSVVKLLRGVCRPWKVLGIGKDKAPPLTPLDETKLQEKAANFVYLFEKLCVLGRKYCRERTLTLMSRSDMGQIFDMLDPSRFQLDFFAEASYRASKSVNFVYNIPSAMSDWLYACDDISRSGSCVEDAFCVVYGSSCSGKTKFVVDLALNLRMQNRLLAAYFINPLVDKNLDQAELFVRSVAYQMAVYCPDLRGAIAAAAKKFRVSEQHLSSQSRLSDKSPGSSNRHIFLVGTTCISRALDLWNEVVIAPWNSVRSASRPRQGSLKGILKKSTGPEYSASDFSNVKNDSLKNMIIVVDGFGGDGGELTASSFTDSIARFFVAIQNTLPHGLKILASSNRNSELMACCRLPKSVASSIFNSSQEDNCDSLCRHSLNPIPVHHCLDLDPLSTSTMLNITHGWCGCPSVSGEVVCTTCCSRTSTTGEPGKSAGSTYSRFEISTIVAPSAKPLIDVLLATRSGRNAILYTSLAIDEVISRFHGSCNVSYESLCSVIPQSLGDLFRIRLERIIQNDSLLFRDLGKLMIMVICHAKRLLSVAEISWLLHIDIDTVLRVASYIEGLFPLVHCGTPGDAAVLKIENFSDEIYYSDGIDSIDPAIFLRPFCDRKSTFNGRNGDESTVSSAEGHQRPSSATALPGYSLDSELEHQKHISPRRACQFPCDESSVESRHRQNTMKLFSGPADIKEHSRRRHSKDPSVDAVDDFSLECEGSSTDLTSDKVGLKSLRHVPSHTTDHEPLHNDEDLHQYFFPIHVSLIKWCKEQNYLFPVELYGHTKSRHDINNCNDVFVASSLEINRTIMHRREVGSKRKDLSNSSLSIKQQAANRVLFATYNYAHLVSHINASLNYKHVAPCMLFSLSWLVGVIKATGVDSLMQRIDKTSRDEWFSLNSYATVKVDKASKLKSKGDYSNSGGSSDFSMSASKSCLKMDSRSMGKDMHLFKFYASLRYLWLCLSRGYFGLVTALSTCREASRNGEDNRYVLLEKEMCFHILNWLTPIADSRTGLFGKIRDTKGCDSASVYSSEGCIDSNSSLSTDSDRSASSSFLQHFSCDDHFYLSGLVKAAQKMNSNVENFRYGVPRLVYPLHFGTSLSVKYLNGRHGDSRLSFNGHSNKVVSLCSLVESVPCQDFIASCSDDCTVRVWNSITGACDASFNSHAGSITCMQPLPHGWLASGSMDLTIHVYSSPNKEMKHQLLGHEGVINCMAYVPRQDLLVSGSEDRTIRLWDYIEGGGPLMVLSGHRKAVTCLLVVDLSVETKVEERSRLADSDCVLLSGSADKTIRSWNISTGKTERIFKGHQQRLSTLVGPFMWSSSVSLVRIGEDSELLDSSNTQHNYLHANFRFCSSEEGDTVIIWSYNDAAIVYQITGSIITAMVDLPRDRIATACSDKVVAIWSADSCRQKYVLRGHTKRISSLARIRVGTSTGGVDPHGDSGSNVIQDFGDLLCSGSDDCVVMVWNTVSGHCLYRLDGPVHAIASVLLSVSLDQLVVSCGCWDGSLHRWILGDDLEQGSLLIPKKTDSSTEHACPVYSAGAYSQHSNRVTGLCPIFLPKSSDCNSDKHEVSQPENEMFGSCSLDGTIRLWLLRQRDFTARSGYEAIVDPKPATRSMLCVAVLKCDRINDISFMTQLSDGRLVVAGLDNTMVIYPFPSSDVCEAIEKESCVTCLLSSVKSVFDRPVVIKGLPCRVTFLSTTIGLIDGVQTELLTTGSEDYIIRFYSVKSGACVKSLDGHVGSITCLQSLSDGRLLSGSDDGNVYLWDLNVHPRGLKSVSPKFKLKRYVSILRGKYPISAMFLYESKEGGKASGSEVTTTGIKICVVTSNGVIHTRNVDVGSSSVRDASKGTTFGAGSTVKALPTADNLKGDCSENGFYPVVHQLLSKGSLRGYMDSYVLNCAIGHHVSDYVTVGNALQRNIIAAGTIQGEVYAFEMFDNEDETTKGGDVMSVSPMKI